MLRLILGFFVLSFSSTVFAQAGSDCKAKSDQAVRSCAGKISAAKNSDVSGFGGSQGMPGGGASLAGAAYNVRATIGEAMSSCSNDDLNTCVNECNAALKSAQSSGNSALVTKIKDNMESCSERIQSQVADGQAAQDRLTQVAAGANESSNQACEDGQTCGTKDPNIVNANTPCPPGSFWSVRWNQCAGIKAFTPRDMIPTPFGK